MYTAELDRWTTLILQLILVTETCLTHNNYNQVKKVRQMLLQDIQKYIFKNRRRKNAS